MNYADGTQNVYESFGSANLNKMREVKRKYDPTNFFGKYWHGGYKIPS
jgi:hypothetical protein